MLRKLLRSLNALFGRKASSEQSKPSVALGAMVGNVKIEKQYQLDKHTAFKPGESYRLGEAIVTVHASKEDMLAAIAVVDARRIAKEKRLTERAIEIMLMTPEQLSQLKVGEWLAENDMKHSIIRSIAGMFTSKRYVKPDKDAFTPPSGLKDERTKEAFSKIIEQVKDIENVK